MAPIIHMLGRINGADVDVGERDVYGLCGVAGVAEETKDPLKYKLSDEKGNTTMATTTIKVVTCQKCSNLLTSGHIHGKQNDAHGLGRIGRARRPDRQAG